MLLCAALVASLPAFADAQAIPRVPGAIAVTAASVITFTASPDHRGTFGNPPEAILTSYQGEFFLYTELVNGNPAGTPALTVNFGKPEPDGSATVTIPHVRDMIGPNAVYVLFVSALGPGGVSARAGPTVPFFADASRRSVVGSVTPLSTPSSSASLSAVDDASSSRNGEAVGAAARQPLFLDLAYSTSLAVDHTPRGIAVDDAGNAYVAGGTMPVDLPATFAAFLRKPSVSEWNSLGTKGLGIVSSDACVTKMGLDGKIMWSTRIGGPGYDRADAIEVDNRGFIYVAGRAGRGFPVTPGAFQPSFQGSDESPPFGPQDGFVCKLTAATGAPVFCSYFGTEDANGVGELAVDGSGNIYLASAYSSGAYPMGVRERFNNRPHVGPEDAVLAKVKGDGSAVLWATYLGGSDADGEGASVRVDAFDNPYFLTTTTSTDALTTRGALGRVYGGNGDLYLARLTPDTGQVMWATYLGGSGRESAPAHNLAVDRSGSITIAVPTLSPDLPTTPGAFQRTYGGGRDVFIARLASDGSRVVAGTYVGGRSGDRSEAVAIDVRGSVHLVGATDSPDFPTTADASRSKPSGTRDTLMFELSPDFGQVAYATYVGSGSNGYTRGLAVDGRGNRYLVGETSIASGQAGNGGRLDSFVMKLAPRRSRDSQP